MKAWIEPFATGEAVDGFAELPVNKNHEILIQDANFNTIKAVPIQRPLPWLGINIVDGELLSKQSMTFQIENRRSVLNPIALKLANVDLNEEWIHNEQF